MKTCFLIPHYNHGQALTITLKKIEQFQLPCIIIDDGSEQQSQTLLDDLEKKYHWLDIIRLNKNTGKGYAVMTGFIYAKKHGFTHALQLDADGQHDVADVPKFLKLSQTNPSWCISGKPIYDNSIPNSRKHGRKINNFWVAIETLSLALPESMCGFRIYPLAATTEILSSHKFGRGMDFDIEILVRLYWQRVPIAYIPTKVIYPENGISHFKLWRDNLVIAKMHAKLFFSMFLQIPQLIKRQFMNN